MLKLAKAKDEKSFYKKFPTQEAFMKVHGKEFKKAQLANSIEKSQNGNWFDKNPIGGSVDYGQPDVEMPGHIDNPGFGIKQKAASDAYHNQEQFDVVGDSSKSSTSNMPGLGQIAGAITDASAAYTAFSDERKQLRSAQQNKGVTDIQLKAANTIDVGAAQQKQDTASKKEFAMRQPMTGENLFPVNGVGTNVLTQNGGRFQGGGEIQNTYGGGNSIYDNGGYEPLNDSNIKNFRDGGFFTAQSGGDFSSFMNAGGTDVASNAVSSGFNNNAGVKTGKAAADVVKMIPGVGPVVSAVAAPVLEAIGGGLDQAFGDAGKIQKTQAGVNRNMQGMMASSQGKQATGMLGSMGVGQNGSELKAYEEGGWVSNDWTPQVIASFGDHSAKDVYDFAHEGMDNLRAGGHLRNYTPPSEHAMETYAMGGQLQTHWGGEAETISHNPYMPGSGETAMFRGASHNNGGIGVSYGNAQNGSNGSQVEVEGGEPIIEMQDGGAIDPNTGQPSNTAVIFGNIPFHKKAVQGTGDEDLIKLADKYDGRTFKSIVADISKTENKGNDFMSKASAIANNADNTKWGSLDKSTADIIQKAGDKVLQNAATSKIKLGNFQTAIADVKNDYSNALGKNISSEHLGKGLIKIDKDPITKNNPVSQNGSALSKLAEGGTTTIDTTKPPEITTARAKELGFKLEADGKYHMRTKGGSPTPTVTIAANANKDIPQQHQDTKTGLYGGVTPEQFEEYKKKNDWYPDWKRFDPKNKKHVANYENAFNAKAKELGSDIQLGQPGKINQQGLFGQQDLSANIDMHKEQAPTVDTDLIANIKDPTDKPFDVVPYNQNKFANYANMLGQFIPKTKLPDLDPRQLSGEMYALSNNNVDPVQANFYHPELGTPYDISYQDQLNANQADYRSAQRMAGYNPAAQGNLNAQKYAANSKVLGEQFRANQSEKSQVYGQNRNTLNDAMLKNLGIADTQYQRQSQALSNTKAVNERALSSIADKYLQNDERNMAYNVQSNMFPTYGYDASGKIHTQGTGPSFNIPQVYGGKGSIKELPVYNADGTIDHYKMQPTDSNTQTANTRNGGAISKKSKGSVVKNAKNGSIVKLHKNL